MFLQEEYVRSNKSKNPAEELIPIMKEFVHLHKKTGIIRRFTEQRAALERMDGQLRQLVSLADGPVKQLGETLLSELAEIRD